MGVAREILGSLGKWRADRDCRRLRRRLLGLCLQPPESERAREHEVVVDARRRLEIGVTALADRGTERLQLCSAICRLRVRSPFTMRQFTRSQACANAPGISAT